MTYEIRIDSKLKNPVVVYIKDRGRTLETLRGTEIEQVEAEAQAWIRERTPNAVSG